MQHHTKRVAISVVGVVGLSAPLALADSLAFSDTIHRHGPSNVTAPSGQFGGQSAWLAFISEFAGPSNIAQRVPSLVRAERNVSLALALALAGPSNTSRGSVPGFGVSTGESGDGPDVPGNPTGLTTSDLIDILNPQDAPESITKSATTQPPSGPGSFQVAVPLPGAGAMAAGGLAIMAFRRRR